MFQLNSFLVIIIIVSCFTFDGLFVTTSAYYCEYGGTTCSNGLQVEYPFSIQNSNYLSNCGYSGFEINCGGGGDDGRPFMNIGDHLYYVLSIDYKQQKLRLKDVDVEGQSCPHPKQSVSQNSATFLESQMVKYYIFYNCSIYPDDSYASQYEPIPCLDNYYNSTVQLRSFAFYNYDSYWYGQNCEKTVVTLVSAFNFTRSAKFGFDLRWSRPFRCDECEGSGGHCYKNTTTTGYQCSCVDDLEAVDGFNCSRVANMSTTSVVAATTTTTTTTTKGKFIIIGVLCGVGGLLLSLFLLYKRIFHSLYHLIFSRWRNKTKGPKI